MDRESKYRESKKSGEGLGRQQHGASLLLINVAQHAPDDDDDAADGNEDMKNNIPTQG